MTKRMVDIFANFGDSFKRKHKFRLSFPGCPGQSGEIFALPAKGNQQIRAIWAICRKEKLPPLFSGLEKNKQTGGQIKEFPTFSWIVLNSGG